ncbi:MAG: DNA polymerase IV, partial [Christensenellaceae bacterium]
WGHILKAYARGEDDSPVATEEAPLKSIGNSITTPKDLYEREEVRKLLTVLAENVARRLRQSAVGKADTVHVVVKDNAFQTHGWQRKIPPTVVSGDIAREAFMLFCEKYTSALGIRMLGVSVSGFDGGVEQLSFLDDGSYRKRESLERALDQIREKYGRDGVQRGSLMGEEDESMELAQKRLTSKHG